jgi:Recombination endonuclease VII
MSNKKANSTSWKKGHSPYNKLDPKEKTKRRRDRVFKMLYGISEEEYLTLRESQGNSCAICKAPMNFSTGLGFGPPKGDTAVLDHNHMTKKLRKFIHNKCNLGIGCFNDDPNLLRSAAEYLEKENASN